MAQTGPAHGCSLTAWSAEARAGTIAQLLGSVGLFSLLLLCPRMPAFGQYVLPPDFQPPAPISSFTFNLEPRRPILVPVEVGGKIVKFALDTGATHHLIDERYEPKLGAPMHERQMGTATPGVQVSVKAFRPPRMLVGQRLVIHRHPIFVVDCQPMSLAADTDVHGILGAPFLADCILSLNFDEGVASITYVPAEMSAEAVVPLRADPAGRPLLSNVRIGDAHLGFLIDTGSNGDISLAKDKFQRFLDEGLITEVHTRSAMTAGGEIHGRSGTLSEISFGPFKQQMLSVSEAAGNAVGLRFLSRFITMFDVPSRQLHVSRSEKYDAPADVPVSCGLTVTLRDGCPAVHIVDAGSPAAAAGLKVGDEVLEVNGIEASGSTMMEAVRLFRGKTGTKIHLVYSRNDEEMAVEIEILPYSKWGHAARDFVSSGLQ